MSPLATLAGLAARRAKLGNPEKYPAVSSHSAKFAKAATSPRPILTLAPGSRRNLDADIPGGTQSGSGPKGRPDCFVLRTSKRRITLRRFPKMSFHDRETLPGSKLENQFGDIFRRGIGV